MEYTGYEGIVSPADLGSAASGACGNGKAEISMISDGTKATQGDFQNQLDRTTSALGFVAHGTCGSASRELPWPGFDVHAHLANTGRTPQQEIIVVDDLIAKATRDSRRLVKRIAQVSKRKQPCGLSDEHLASLQDEHTSCMKVITGLKATRTAVLALVAP